MLQINELHKLFRKRSDDFDKIQDGMERMKEFEKTKAQMEQELSDVRKGGNISVSVDAFTDHWCLCPVDQKRHGGCCEATQGGPQ